MTRSIRPYLEYQADRVEGVLAAHRTPGRVTGGTVGPRHIRFFVNPAPHIRFASIQRLQDDLALALKVHDLTIDRGKEGVILEFANPNPGVVSLEKMLADVTPVPVSSALLGLTDDGSPLLVRLAAPEVAHILVSGTTGSGKTELLRAIAASLALNHTPRQLQLLCIDPKARAFRAFDDVGHLARPVITAVETAVEALYSAVRELERRDAQGLRPGNDVPRIVILIDELADLVMTGGEALVEQLVRIAQRGREAGIHLIAATQHPSSAILSSVMKANFPTRLVGKVASADDARVASGRAGTNAHLLNGRGDFLALSSGNQPIRFQAAYATAKTLDALLATARGLVTLDVTGLRDWAAAHHGQAVIVERAQPATLHATPRMLPVTATNQVGEGTQSAIDYLRPAWSELRETYLGGEVNKSELCRMIWEGARGYNGYWQRSLDEAVTQLEAEISTSTSPSTYENAPFALEGGGEGRVSAGGGGGGDHNRASITKARVRRTINAISATA